MEETSASRFFAKKSLGQHFLSNTRIPQLMVEAGEVQKGEHVLEIGPGTGVLTDALLRAGAKVLALEADARAIEILRVRFAECIKDGSLTIIGGDARELFKDDTATDPRAVSYPQSSCDRFFDEPYKVIANIPYYLTGYLFRVFLTRKHQPMSIVYLIQREVATRIARSSKESLLSLSIKAYGNPSYIATVKPGNFTPPPRVDSAILKVSTISKENFRTLDESFFFSILHLGFGSKRKQLLGNLAKEYTRENLIQLFEIIDIPLDVRAEDVPLQKWLALCKQLSSHSSRL